MKYAVFILLIVLGVTMTVFPKKVIEFLISLLPLPWLSEYEPDAGGIILTAVLGVIAIVVGAVGIIVVYNSI